MTAVHNSKSFLHPKYRKDIDGLRAIAIISVVLFHAFPQMVPGGFIGVDIFFVISGYLITLIIVSSLNIKSFFLIDFYVRRINRIFPGLAIVLTVCLYVGWLELFPEEYGSLGKEVFSGALFTANYLFWSQGGYFDSLPQTKPLLNLWSLAVEEQFYLLWPILLWMGFKLRLNLLRFTILIALISFVINVANIYGFSGTFFSPLTRFWELLIGSIMAQLAIINSNNQNILFKISGNWISTHLSNYNNDYLYKTINNANSIIGTALILIGFFIITPEKLIPGWLATLPVIGAVLIISAGPHGMINRTLLSNPVLVFFGLISFPLYLYHWPLLSFSYIFAGPPVESVRIMLILVSIVLAWITYRVFERYFRFSNNRKRNAVLLLIYIAILGTIGYLVYTKDGIDTRLTISIKNNGDIGHELFFKEMVHNFYKCTPSNIYDRARYFLDYHACFQSKLDKPIDLALLGDSHAEHLFIGLAEALPNKNVVYYLNEIFPLINKDNRLVENIISDADIKTVILSAYWVAQVGRGQNGIFEFELSKTVEALIGAKKIVYIADDLPGFEFDAKQCKYANRITGEVFCKNLLKTYQNSRGQYYPVFQAIIKKYPNVKLIETNKFLCDDKFCYMALDHLLLYRDSNHLNINGSKFVADSIVKAYPELAK